MPYLTFLCPAESEDLSVWWLPVFSSWLVGWVCQVRAALARTPVLDAPQVWPVFQPCISRVPDACCQWVIQSTHHDKDLFPAQG